MQIYTQAFIHHWAYLARSCQKLRSAGLAEACQEAKEHPRDPAEGRDGAEQMQEGGRAPLVLGDGY